MQCPNCKHQASSASLVKCSNCGIAFERQHLEEYEHIGYMRNWLADRRQRVGNNFEVLDSELASRAAELTKLMRLEEIRPPVPLIIPKAEKPVLESAAAAPIEELAAAEAVPLPVQDVAEQRVVDAPANLISGAAAEPARGSAPDLAPKLAVVAVAPLPARPAPRKPPQPPIEWGKIWDRAVNFVVSGALLRALLYLGAFMIVVSAAVLVINFWEIFPPFLQVIFIFALPTSFYAAGWLTRSRLKLVQAGMVLTGVGAILLAVDFAALYQFSNLNIDLAIYWLVAALACTAIYIFTALRLQGEFFDYLALLGSVNIVLALTRLVRLPLEWSSASIPLASTGIICLAGWSRKKGEAWRDTERAAYYLPQVLVPLSLVALLFATETNSQAARAFGFLFASSAYGLLAWQLPAVYQLILALGSLAVAVAFGMLSVDSKGLWLATAAAVLSPVYILCGWGLFREQNISFSLHKAYRQVFNLAGYALAVLVLLFSLELLDRGETLLAAIPLTLLGLSFCAWNLLLRQPLWGYLGGGLLLLPAWLWFDLVHLSPDIFPLAYLLLVSFVYLPAALLLRRWEKKYAAPFELLSWLVSGAVFVASFLIPARDYPWIQALTLTLLAAYFGFNAWQYRHFFFNWCTAAAIPVALFFWMVYWGVAIEFVPVIWVGLAFGYLLVERYFKKLEKAPWAIFSFRLPLGLGIVVFSAISVFTGLLAYLELSAKVERLPFILVSQGLVIGLTILAARIYRSRWPLFCEPLLAALLASLFFTTYSARLFGSGLSWYQYGLVLCSVAWLHLLVAARVDRLPARYAHGLYLGGYGLLTLGVLVSVANLPTFLWTSGGLILAMLASAVLVDLNHHYTWNELAGLFGKPEQDFNRLVSSAFAWLAAWLFPIWCALLLVQIKAPPGLPWLGISLPALLYLGAGLRLANYKKVYSWVLFSAAHVFSLVALLYSLDRVSNAGLQVAFGLTLPLIKPAVLSIFISQGIVQLVAVVFYATWAWKKQQPFFSHVAAWLSFFPFTSLLLSLQVVPARLIVVAWAGWAVLLLLVGFLLDWPGKSWPRHAHGPYLAGYIVAILSLIVSMADRWLSLIVLGICIASATCSFVALHFKRHAAFEDLICFLWYKDTLTRRGVRLVFLFFAVYAFPLWLAQLEAYFNLGYAWQGVSLALLAPLYIAGGLLLRRLNPDYTWPFYSAGYALTALGAMIAFADQRLATYVLALDVAVYAASAVIFRKPFWLYLATFLTPLTLLVALDYGGRLTPDWIAWSFTALSFLYFGLGQLLGQRSRRTLGVARFALPCYIPGYLLSAIALALSLASNDRTLALAVYPVNILLYALSAWRMREILFLYPAAWLSIVPYFLFATTYFMIPLEWQGVAWLPLILIFIVLGRFVFQKKPLNLKTPGAIFNTLVANPAMPFYTMAYILSVTMVLGSRWTPVALTIGSALAALLYLASALLFRHPAWLYPTLVAAHLTIIAFFMINPSGSPARYIALPFLALTWLEAIAGFIVSRRYPVTQMTSSGRLVFKFFNRQVHFGEFPAIGYLTIPSWAQPIFIFIALDTLLWESVALSGLDTGAWISAGFFLLFALLTMAWRDQFLAHLSLGLLVTAAGYQLGIQGLTALQVFASLGGVAFILYILYWLVELLGNLLMVWHRPLLHAAIGVSGLSLLMTLPAIASDSISTAFALGFSGAIYLTMSLRRRTYLLGYVGMGMLLAGWSLFLFVRNVPQPQLYAIPGGLYFTGIGFFERARRPGRFALLIESLGLALLLVTSFVQSVDGESGFPYFLLLFVQALLVIWWGAARRLRVPFIIGLVASVVNVLAQVVVLVRVYEVNRWVIIFGAGILLVSLGLFVERRREMLLARAHELRDMLERWD